MAHQSAETEADFSFVLSTPSFSGFGFGCRLMPLRFPLLRWYLSFQQQNWRSSWYPAPDPPFVALLHCEVWNVLGTRPLALGHILLTGAHPTACWPQVLSSYRCPLSSGRLFCLTCVLQMFPRRRRQPHRHPYPRHTRSSFIFNLCSHSRSLSGWFPLALFIDRLITQLNVLLGYQCVISRKMFAVPLIQYPVRG